MGAKSWKIHIRETKHLWTDADSSTDTKQILLVKQNSLKIKLIFERQFYTPYEQNYLNLRPFLSISYHQGFRKSKKFGHWTFGSGGNKTCNFKPFLRQNFHIWDQFFPLVSPKDSKSLKNLDIRYPEVGAKRCLSGNSKVKKFSFKKSVKNFFLPVKF